VNWGRVAQRGIVSGLVGGIIMMLFLFAAQYRALSGSIFALWSTQAADIHQTSPWIGLLAFLVVSIAWGFGYAYVAQTRASIVNRPWISGFFYGLVVWLVMQVVLMAGEVWNPASLATYPLVVSLFAHAFFFGIPVALTARAMSSSLQA
jgi:hypothetical protein